MAGVVSLVLCICLPRLIFENIGYYIFQWTVNRVVQHKDFTDATAVLKNLLQLGWTPVNIKWTEFSRVF